MLILFSFEQMDMNLNIKYFQNPLYLKSYDYVITVGQKSVWPPILQIVPPKKLREVCKFDYR